MDTPLLQTKLYTPLPRANPSTGLRTCLVARPRLIERLNAGLTCKLTLISAPAGFGKTTLLSDWLRKIELPVAWLSLDDSDNDLARFLGARIGQHDSSRGDRLSAGGILELEP